MFVEHAATPEEVFELPPEEIDANREDWIDQWTDSCSADPPRGRSVALLAAPVAFLAVLLRLAGRQHRRRGPARRRTGGTSAGCGRCSATPQLRQVAWFTAVAGGGLDGADPG